MFSNLEPEKLYKFSTKRKVNSKYIQIVMEAKENVKMKRLWWLKISAVRLKFPSMVAGNGCSIKQSAFYIRFIFIQSKDQVWFYWVLFRMWIISTL